MELEEYLKMLQARYEAYFDTSPDYSILGRTIDLYACCHIRSEKFSLAIVLVYLAATSLIATRKRLPARG